jgi:hypothetical protein
MTEFLLALYPDHSTRPLRLDPVVRGGAGGDLRSLRHQRDLAGR